MTDRIIETHRIFWKGMTIEVLYEPQWLSSAMSVAHVQIRTIAPERAPLPFTETGYKSHFTAPDHIVAQGGPVAYVTAWLNAEATSKKWLAAELARRQPDLFE